MAEFKFIEEQEVAQEKVTPSPTEVFKRAMRGMAMEMRVSMPAEVTRYDHKKQLVDVQPYFKRRYKDGKVEDAPVIYNVPVGFLRANGAWISVPLEKGDSVWLIFADRSLEKWLSSGESGDPQDTRIHDMSDAIAYPGVYPFSDPAPINNPKDLIIRNADKEGKNFVEFRVKKNNHLQILNKSDELLKVLDDLVKTIRAAVVYTSTGVQKLKHKDFAKVHARLKTFVEK